jgi:hypothetical protein
MFAWTIGLCALCTSACSGDDGIAAAESPGGGGIGGAGGVPPGGAGGSPPAAGGAGMSAGGSAGAGGGGAGGAAGSGGGTGVRAGCTNTLAPPRTNTLTRVSDMVLDYPLSGAPAATHYNVLILMFNASSKNASTPDQTAGVRDFYTAEQLGDVFFNDPNGVHAFVSEVSYGKVSLSGRIVGWIDLPPMTGPADDFRVNVDSYAERATAYATLADYDIVYIVGLTDGTGMQIGWGLENYLRTSQGTATVGIDYMINSFFFTEAGGPYPFSVVLPSRSWSHELMHTLGISGHDISLDCGSVPYGTTCNEIIAYGNPFSVMGESAFGNHPSVNMKAKMGFLDAAQVETVTRSGTYMLCPTSTVDGKTKGLSIPLKTPLVIAQTMSTAGSATMDRLLIEYRRNLGFDRYLDRLGTDYLNRYKDDGPVRSDGVLVSLGYSDAQTQSTLQLDMHPGTPFNPSNGTLTPGNIGRMADATLLVGETFSMTEQSITVKVESLTDDGGIVVNVTY